jgi:transcription elongation factor Elf1
MRTASDIQEEIGELKKELDKLLTTCDHRLNAIHVHKHQNVAYKKCLACGHSVKVTLNEVYQELEGL